MKLIAEGFYQDVLISSAVQDQVACMCLYEIITGFFFFLAAAWQDRPIIWAE